MKTNYLKLKIEELIKSRDFNRLLSQRLNIYKNIHGITNNISIEEQILLEDFIYNYFLSHFYIPTTEYNKDLIINTIQDDEWLNDWFMDYVVL